jgi:hypothetical protein
VGFDARAWFAGQVGCTREELELDELEPPNAHGTQRGFYTKAGASAGTVVITGVVHRQARRRQVTAAWPDGEARADIAPDEPIVW